MKEVWLPEGEWYEWYTGAKMQGPGIYTRSYLLEEVPVFVKAGAIVPMQPDMLHTGEKAVDPLILTIFPGREGSMRVYEDAGNSVAYQKGECAWTPVTMKEEGVRDVAIAVGPRTGSYPGMPAERAYEFRLVNRMPPELVEIDGHAVPNGAEGSGPGWWYDGERATIVVRTARVPAGEEVELEVKGSAGSGGQYANGLPGTLRRLRKGMDLINAQWPKEWSSGDLVAAVQTGNRMSRWPGKAPAELEALNKRIDVALKQLGPLAIPDSVRIRVHGLLDRGRELLSR
jgi:alpha-glucosidase